MIPPDYGLLHLGIDDLSDDEAIQARIRAMLARALNTEQCVAFIGSGVSRAYYYPLWRDLTAAVVQMTLSSGVALNETVRVVLESFDPTRVSTTERLLFVLSECADAYQKAGEGLGFKRRFAGLIRPDPPPGAVGSDPLKVILDLGIRRFLTINYDLAIEEAFERHAGEVVKPPESGPLLSSGAGDRIHNPVRLSVGETRPEMLSLFACGAPGFQSGVLHCHGHVDDSDHLVLTERDYQQAYLSPEVSSRAYREALELAFSASPILFLGVGLEEGDLLRPLREWLSAGGGIRERPLFALLERSPTNLAYAHELRRHHYLRYGLKILYYDLHDPAKQSRLFCSALEELDRERRGWWSRWQRKPILRREPLAVRETVVRRWFGSKRTTRVAFLRRIDPRPEMKFDAEPPEDLVRALSDERCGRLVVLIGRPGSGKGAVAARLMEESTTLPNYRRKLFGSTHFTNEFLSVIESACSFFGEGVELPNDTPVERLRHALERGPKPALFVLHGVERLLRRPHSSGGKSTPWRFDLKQHHVLGAPLTSSIRRFLTMLREASETDGVHIVLTSALWPTTLRPTEGEVSPVEVAATGFPLGAFIGHSLLAGVSKQLLADYHHALRGHTYALCLTMALMRHLGTRREPWLHELFSRMCSMNQTRRPSYVVKRAFEALRADHRGAEEVLTKVALFTAPVSAADLLAVVPQDTTQDVETVLKFLHSSALLERLSGDLATSEAGQIYTAHTLVRSFVLNRGDRTRNVAGEPQRFVLPSYAEQADEVQQPTPTAYNLSTQACDFLLSAAREVPYAKRTHLLRGAFGIIRGRWNFAAVARLHEDIPLEQSGITKRPHLDSYGSRLLRLVNAIRDDDEFDIYSWLFHETLPREEVEGPRGVLTSVELGWLMNELALMSYAQGNMFDAQALFRLAQHIAGVAERGAHERNWCSSEINMATILLERGRIARSRHHLERALEAACEIGDRGLEGQVLGYLGQVAHLGASFEQAEALYSQAIDLLSHAGNRRGKSTFLRMNGDLLLSRGDSDRAAEYLRRSRVEAELGHHIDLFHGAAVSEAKVLGVARDPAAMRQLQSALTYARRIGLLRLEADCLRVLSRFALREADLTRANHLVSRALAMAAAGGQALRITSCLAMLGQILMASGDGEGAATVLDASAALGRYQGYVLKVERAERERGLIPNSADRPAV